MALLLGARRLAPRITFNPEDHPCIDEMVLNLGSHKIPISGQTRASKLARAKAWFPAQNPVGFQEL